MLLPTVSLPNSIYLGYSTMTSLIPFMVELTLLLRILAVYPFNTTPRIKFVAIMTFPVLMKIARLVNLCITLVNLSRSLARYNRSTDQNPYASGVVSIKTLPNSEIEWFLQVFDNFYASTVFLLKLNYRPFFGQSDGFRSSSITKKFRGIFWIAVSNFIIPAIFSLTQAILYLVNKENSLLILQINLTNNYISIIAIVFATLWVSGNSWYRENIPNGTDVLSTFRARRITEGESRQPPVSNRRDVGFNSTKPNSDSTPIAQVTECDDCDTYVVTNL